MEEKKLTDEEIVKALECCIHDDLCKACPLYAVSGCIRKRNIQVLDLIHRLQKAKEFFEKGYEVTKKIIDEKNEKICKLEEENERLQDEKKELKSIAEYQQGSNMERWQIIQEKDKTIADQKAEIERLTEYNANLNGMCLEFIDKNTELKKQVDELTAFKKEAISMSLYGKGRKDGEEVAVKDTAKEIYEKAKEKSILTFVNIDDNPRKDRFIFLSDLENIIRKKGVEVE
jgi:DNA repair exonuclease SbcCD ATPase subunit